MLSKIEIIELHGKIILDLLLLIDQSDKIAKSTNMYSILYNGIVVLNHVFNMNIIHDTPKYILLHNCQKGSVCYLEYIEQACDKKIMDNIDFSVIYVFICKQTMNFLNNYDCAKAPPNIYNLLNILQKNMDTIVLLNLDLHLKILIRFTDIYLVNFAKLLYRHGNDRKAYYSFMSIVFEKIKESHCENSNSYFVFLNTLYLNLYKLKSKNMLEVNQCAKENVLYALLMDCDFEKDQSIKKLVKYFLHSDIIQ